MFSAQQFPFIVIMNVGNDGAHFLLPTNDANVSL
jgi:hypothetical protein